MTPAEILLAVQVLSALLTEAINVANLIKAQHSGAASGATSAQVAAAANAAAVALSKFSADLKG